MSAVRRRTPFVLVAIGVALLLGWYVTYTQQVVAQLRREAAGQGRMYSRVYQALADTSSNESARFEALLDLARMVKESGVPLILTDPDGRVADTANLPFSAALDSEDMRAYLAQMDRRNAPIDEAGAGAVHYGDGPLIRGLAVIPLLQAGALGLLVLFGAWGLRERGRAEREKVWAGMARESAHQLGTPLSSLAGWLELLSDRGNDDPTLSRAVSHMEQDITRLDRVAHRFERIGRPPRRDPVDCGALVERIGAYFAARVPKKAKAVTIHVERPDEPLTVAGDAVLLEWVLEVLVKNAVDALGGRGGSVTISAEPLGEGGIRMRVADDGPGIPRAMRRRVFDAGYTTKERGWGIGLALARRIAEENHGGKLVLVDSAKGAAFDVILPG